MTNRQYISQWNKHCKFVLQATPIDINEPLEKQKQRIAELEANPEEWFKYYFPGYTTAEPADFHKAATQRVLSHPEWYEVRMWSRELAKTTRTMMEVLYLTLVGYPHATPPSPLERVGERSHATSPSSSERAGERSKRYVLLISNSFANATRLLIPYKANLEKNRRLIHDYGPQKKQGNWSAGEFITQSGIGFRALGAGQSPRGTRNEDIRPDVIIFDDVDTDKDCLNPNQVIKKWRWIEEAAISTRSISSPLLTIFCGNRIAVDSCIERATKYADHTDIINIKDENGNSTWPQKNTLLDIERVLKQKSYAARQKEYFNNPITEGSVFKKMNYKPARPLIEYSLLVCYTDPSFKDTKKSDYKATVLVGKWKDEYHVIKCFLQQTSTTKMVDWHYKIMEIVGHYTCYYFVEENNISDSLTRAFQEAQLKTGKYIPVKMDKRSKQDKFTRIESLLEPLHSDNRLFLNSNEINDPNMQTLEEQFISISPKSRAHDDGPDAVEGAVWILNQKSTILKPDSFFSFTKRFNPKSF